MNVEDFIKQHTHTGYCEAIILPNGDIHYAVDGHTNDLIRVANKPKRVINKIMPQNASPLHWLVCYTKCVSLWYNFFIYNSMTDAQINTIKELVNHDILANVVEGIFTDELERCDLLNKLYRGEIDISEIPEKPKGEYTYIWKDNNYEESKCSTN